MGESAEVFMLLCQQWSIYRRGDGSIPDGHSFHLSEEARQSYVERRLRVQEQEEPGAPEYEAPNGDPYWVSVKGATHLLVSRTADGRRHYNNTPEPPPEAQGIWRPSNQKKTS